VEIWQNALGNAQRPQEKARPAGDIKAIGITNQRETTVVWDRKTGDPLYNAIVWQCTRTGASALLWPWKGDRTVSATKPACPSPPIFPAPKSSWILDNVPAARQAAKDGNAYFGTIESWIMWWLTGGPDGGSHVTDVTNASRTLFMNLKTLDWDDDILDILGIPRAMLPRIVPSVDRNWGIHLRFGSPGSPGTGLRRPGRPTGRPGGPDLLFRWERLRTPMAPVVFCCSTPATASFRHGMA
jgi:glycerol kinase